MPRPPPMFVVNGFAFVSMPANGSTATEARPW
jgi:hypothetical protein